jgi:hypothetical protein
VIQKGEGQKQSKGIEYNMTQMLELTGKGYKAAIINVFKKLINKENSYQAN